MPNYTKLFSSIVTSTIWTEGDKTRIVWITLLALADQHGEIHASIPGLARVAGVPLEDCEAAINRFLSPDKYSRTPDMDGRRLVEIAGGWELVNHAKYRKLASKDDQREATAERVRRFRARNGDVTHRNDSVTQNRDIAEAEAEAEAEAILPKDKPRKPSARAKLSDADFLKSLRENPAYTGHDIDRELGKMQAWLSTPKGRGRKLTQGFVVNWLNRLDAPISATVKKPGRNW